MKKVLLVAAIAGMAFASCKKDRTCTCSITQVSSTYDGVSQTISPTPFTQEQKMTKVSKNGAHCNSGTQTDTQTSNGHTTVDVYKADCTLK